MFSQEQIEAVKQANDIVAVIKAKGVKLRKKGNNFVGLCPFHAEDKPSFTVDPVKQLYHCFGCKDTGKGSTGGDVISFVAKHDNLVFEEAMTRLGHEGKIKRPLKPLSKPEKPDIQPAKRQKLLQRVVDFYHQTFNQDDKGFAYLNSRKITDKNSFASFKIGYANGTLLNALPEDGSLIDELKTIGILNAKGHELFYGSVTFPIYDQQGNVTLIYGRKISDQENNHLYLPSPRSGVFNWQCVKTNEAVILTESIIDALTLYNAGLKNTIPCYGTNGLTQNHLDLVKQYSVKTIYLCLNGDQPGMDATVAMTGKLSAIAQVHSVMLPDNQDINEFFSLAAHPVDAFNELLLKSDPGLAKTIKKAPEDK